MIKSFHYNISSISLTKTIFEDMVMQSDGYVMLVSPLGNAFTIGNTDDIEEFEVDEFHTEYQFQDGGGITRKILFHQEYSDYGILISEGGLLRDSTGSNADDTDTEDYRNFIAVETGMVGQEICESEDE